MSPSTKIDCSTTKGSFPPAGIAGFMEQMQRLIVDQSETDSGIYMLAYTMNASVRSGLPIIVDEAEMPRLNQNKCLA